MKRLIVSAALLVVAIGFTVAPATAAPPTGNKIACEAGTPATCTLLSPNRAYLDTSDGGYAAVYTENSVAVGTPLSEITKLGFSYEGTTPYGGAPRISIGIDENGDGSGWDAFAFVDAAGCNDGFGKVDVINDSTCTVWYGSTSYPNWAAFVAANPTYDIGYAYTFVVADAPGEWTISNVQLGAKSRGGK